MKNLERFHKILDEKNIKKISETKVMIIGLGGVGGYATESLARSGINTLILVDYDVFDITNLNRQIGALKSTVGRLKVDVYEERIKDINESINIIKIKEKILKDNIDLIFNQDFDYLIDACDTITTKKEIIKNCLKYKKKFISSMGTGNKFDPEKLKIMDIKNTEYDPVAKMIRKMLKDENIKGKIKVVSSNEKGIKHKDRTPGSTSFVPPVSGFMCASYVINDILRGE